MSDYFVATVSEKEIKKEREKARRLRKTRWWQRKKEKGICYYCHQKVPSHDLTMDHVVPVIRGGKSTKGNIVAVCPECNARKKYLLPWEWDDFLARQL